ncbi:hypothetical protein E3N88_07560 [Mikania micrantha]|uniref:Uncharacterized protein n=1 Tax=Mikania micrantha TaxID=192012 RepID=A0A5N6PRV6_9ASTR|nr:hypothetical protein E3N88_07560 [Mikania micrantha]
MYHISKDLLHSNTFHLCGTEINGEKEEDDDDLKRNCRMRSEMSSTCSVAGEYEEDIAGVWWSRNRRKSYGRVKQMATSSLSTMEIVGDEMPRDHIWSLKEHRINGLRMALAAEQRWSVNCEGASMKWEEEHKHESSCAPWQHSKPLQHRSGLHNSAPSSFLLRVRDFDYIVSVVGHGEGTEEF